MLHCEAAMSVDALVKGETQKKMAKVPNTLLLAMGKYFKIKNY
jgi:hypothetical protein